MQQPIDMVRETAESLGGQPCGGLGNLAVAIKMLNVYALLPSNSTSWYLLKTKLTYTLQEACRGYFLQHVNQHKLFLIHYIF